MFVKVLLLAVFGLFVGCTSQKNPLHNRDMIAAITEAIDSQSFPEKIIAVIKSEYNYEDYNLYVIKGFRIDLFPDDYPYEIQEIQDKLVFFFSRDKKELSHDYVEEIVEKYYNHSLEINSNTAFFFLQCNSCEKNILYHAVNEDIRSYEIPEIRTFSCSSQYIPKKDIELITHRFEINVPDNNVIENNVVKEFPHSIQMLVAVYNRTGNSLDTNKVDFSMGTFKLINGMDTLFFNAENEPLLTDYIIDDPTYKEDPEKYARLWIKSKKNPDFFNIIDSNNYYANLISLIRDSLYYYPDDSFLESYDKDRKTLNRKITVITPPEGVYVYNTPTHIYWHSNGKMLFKDKKH